MAFTRVDAPKATDSGAFEVDKNIATMAGYGAIGAGTMLAVGVGSAVVPVPVLGLTSLGAGLCTVGYWDDLKSHFSKDDDQSEQQTETTDQAAQSA